MLMYAICLHESASVDLYSHRFNYIYIFLYIFYGRD